MIKKRKMIDNNLIAYIEQNLNRSYSVSSIQNALIKQGYSAKNVLDTINYVQENSKGTQKIPIQSQSTSKKALFILIPVVLIIIIGLSIFFFTSFSSQSISEDDLSQGTNFNLKENKEVKFNLDEEAHTIKVDSVTDDSVSLTIQSNPIKVDLNIGEEKKFDLNNDGFYDIKIKLNNIVDGVPDIFVKKIHESTCVENWNCGSWSDCTEQGTQTRTCTDTNACGTSKNKPPTTQSCTYVKPCTENWNCGSWSECTEQGKQSRTCTDLNSCGTTKSKPSTTQSCTYVATCSEDWECTDWSSCVGGQKTRTCTDTNSCGTTEDKPDEQQNCQVQITDCGTNVLSEKTSENVPNFDCFIEAAQICNPAKLLNTVVIDILGMLSTSTTRMEIKGMESDKCIYYQRTESNSVEFTEEMIQQILDGGATQEEIDQQLQISNDVAQEAVGMEVICKFNREDLTAMLNNWKQGLLQGGDLLSGDCEVLS